MEKVKLSLLKRFRPMLRFLGPGFLVTVGFIDPGNWATNIAGGAQFGYQLLWVITLSTLMLILIQNMSARYGIATGESLASGIKRNLPPVISAAIGVTVVLACVATDVAELLGAAIGFQLLFGFPLWAGALITVFLEVFFIVTQRYHRLEKFIIGFLGVISLCFLFELFIVKPQWAEVLPAMVIPHLNTGSIFIAMGILGAVVMPHNIFLHSNVIHSRHWGTNAEAKKTLIKYEKTDTALSMGLGWAVNSAMIIVAGAVFFHRGFAVDTIQQASDLLTPLAGGLAGLLFAVALVFSGVSSSITSSMAEVNVITAFLGKPEDSRTVLYRIATFITAVPSFIIIVMGLDTFKILIYSQVVLSIQLPFTLIPLLILCRRKNIMGELKSGNIEFSLALFVSLVVIMLNLYLLYGTFA